MKLSLDEFEWVDEAPSKVTDGFKWVKIEEGEWISGGKWEYQTCIVLDTETSKFYRYELSRSGSYYSDYYYKHLESDGYVELEEVVQKERVVVEKYWEKV